MADEEQKSFNPRGLPRIPLKLRVNMEFEKFSGFISEYSENISEGGMFIKTNTPRPMGSVFSLEFKLKDDYKLIQGWGEVAWVREKAEGPNKPAGMGIKFLDLDQASRDLIRNIIKIHKKETGSESIQPFEFMKSDEEEEKKGDIDLSDVKEEVFGAGKKPTEAASPVEDIFKDIKSEMDTPKDAPKDEPKPILKAEKQATVKKAEAGTDEKSFVDEVFGKEEAQTKLSKKLSDISAIKRTYEKQEYRKVSWYSNPASVIVLLIFILIGFVVAFFHKNIYRTAMVMITYFTEQQKIVYRANVHETPLVVKIPQATDAPEAAQERNKAAPDHEPAKEDRVASSLAAAKQEPIMKNGEPRKAKAVRSVISRTAKEITNVEVRKLGDGKTKVYFSLDKPVDIKTLSAELLEAPPRYLVKIPGINKPYKRMQMTFINPYLKKIRMGLHQNPDSVHIVFDLNRLSQGDRVTLEETKEGFTVVMGSK